MQQFLMNGGTGNDSPEWLTSWAAFWRTTFSDSVHLWTGTLTLESSTLLRHMSGHVDMQSITYVFVQLTTRKKAEKNTHTSMSTSKSFS